jgi:hypothetical protein
VTDARLRALERRVANEPTASIALAHALERLGDAAAALDALWSGCDDLEVRRAAATLDLERAPARSARLLWQQRLDRRDDLRLRRLETPLGLVLQSAQRVAVLDPRTGKLRFELPPAEWFGCLCETLIVSDAAGNILGTDLWTGESLYTAPFRARGPRMIGGDLLVISSDDQVIAHRYEDSRRPPLQDWCWTSDAGRFMRGRIQGDAVVLDGFWQGSEGACTQVAVVLDARSGQERFRIDAAGSRLVASGHGLFAVQRSVPRDGYLSSTIAFLDGSGRTLWTAPETTKSREVLRITRTSVHIRHWKPGNLSLALHDRMTGAQTETIDLGMESLNWSAVDDVHFGTTTRPSAASDDFVAAWTSGGVRLWTWRPRRLPAKPPALVLLPGRVYVQSGRDVTCLVEEARTAPGHPSAPAASDAP